MIRRLLLVLVAGVLAMGFRPMSPEDRALKIIKKAEGHFALQEYAELYKYVRIDHEGKVFEGRMLIIFRYKDDQISGIFRLLPDDDNEGVTLISLQEPNKHPELYHDNHNTNRSGPVKLMDLHQKLGDTDWFFEGIYDDDHNPWAYRRTATVGFRGNTVDVIEARYTDEELKKASGYEFRRILIRKSDEQPMAIECYEDTGEIIYAIELLSNDRFEFKGEENLRAKQIQLIDFDAKSTTILTRVRSNWAPQLPDKLYELKFAEKWDAATDEMIINKLLSDNARY